MDTSFALDLCIRRQTRWRLFSPLKPSELHFQIDVLLTRKLGVGNPNDPRHMMLEYHILGGDAKFYRHATLFTHRRGQILLSADMAGKNGDESLRK